MVLSDRAGNGSLAMASGTQDSPWHRSTSAFEQWGAECPSYPEADIIYDEYTPLVTRKKRQGQYRLTGFIFYDHHQRRIVVPALFSKLPDFMLRVRKCRFNIRQVRTMMIIFNSVPSAYCEEISRHRTPPRLHQASFFISLTTGRKNIDVDQSRASTPQRFRQFGEVHRHALSLPLASIV